MPNRHDFHSVQKKVDFNTHQILIFTWEGDAQDRLKVESKANQIRFIHWGNKSEKDPHLHCRLFVMAKDARYSVLREPDPR